MNRKSQLLMYKQTNPQSVCVTDHKFGDDEPEGVTNLKKILHLVVRCPSAHV